MRSEGKGKSYEAHFVLEILKMEVLKYLCKLCLYGGEFGGYCCNA